MSEDGPKVVRNTIDLKAGFFSCCMSLIQELLPRGRICIFFVVVVTFPFFPPFGADAGSLKLIHKLVAKLCSEEC